jgi:hypothetical protein
MVDIGISRRKNGGGGFHSVEWYVEDTPEAPSCAAQAEYPMPSKCIQAPAASVMFAEAVTDWLAPNLATMPTLDLLTAFEGEWGEDSFSAYGFTLMMVLGESALHSGQNERLCFKRELLLMPCTDSPKNAFWFPFAFKISAFLDHYQSIFVSPDVIIPLYSRSAKRLKALALERGLRTIRCVESQLLRLGASNALWDRVLIAVLALICYNVSIPRQLL